MQQGPSNEDRLREEGIIEPTRTLSPEQQAAIESLTAEEVDQLIATNTKLEPQISPSEVDPVIELPGRNPNPPESSKDPKY